MDKINVNRGVRHKLTAEFKTSRLIVNEALNGSERTPLHVAIRNRAKAINEDYFNSLNNNDENKSS